MIIIFAPHFVAGAVLINGTVSRCAPIIKYMEGWSQSRVLKYCKKKGWDAYIQRIKGDK